jgi:hypothetical protein
VATGAVCEVLWADAVPSTSNPPSSRMRRGWGATTGR